MIFLVKILLNIGIMKVVIRGCKNIKKYKSFMKCQNLIDFSERKVYATKKERKSRNRRGYR